MVEIIAEVATNHGGDLGAAWRFVRECAKAGVDTVKFQLIRWEDLRPEDVQFHWFQRSELSLATFATIKEMCEDSGVGFLLTAFNAKRVAEVRDLGCSRIKVGSGEAGEVGLARAIRGAGFEEVLVSMGLSERQLLYGAPTRFLGCVTRYPAPPGIAYATLAANPELAGWSDHSEGLDECKAAVVAGARILEMHVQLPGQKRPPRPFEKTMEELRELREFCNENPQRFLGRWQRGA